MEEIIFSSSFRSFLKSYSSPVARLLYRLIDIEYQHPTYKKMFNPNSGVNYITFRKDGQISFLPEGKKHIVLDSGEWAREGRQSGKPSKIVRRLFSAAGLKVLKDKDFEDFSNIYKATFSSEGNIFTVRSNKSIIDVYCDMEIGGSRESPLAKSCMNKRNDYLKLYHECRDVRILTLTKLDGLLYGRALVWTVNDITFMDRIYVAEDFLAESFLEFAKEQGWHHKLKYLSRDNKIDFITPTGECIALNLRLDLKTDFKCYPYIDTLSYGGDGWLSNREVDWLYEYSAVDGGRETRNEDEDDGTVYDEIDERTIDANDAVRITGGTHRGNWTHLDNVVLVNGRNYWMDDDCLRQVDGEYYHEDDVVYSDRDDVDYLIDDCVFSKSCDSYILSSDSTLIDEEYHHVDDVVDVLGIMYHKDNVPQEDTK